MLTHTLGFPRIGLNRELKRVTEKYWKGEASREELTEAARELRLTNWALQRECGIDLVPAGDFSLYDHILDTTAMLGAVPERYSWDGGQVGLDMYFRMARGKAGAGGVTAMEMTKWFDTNYHYIVPEFRPDQKFSVSTDKLLSEAGEAASAGFKVKAVLPGPLTYIYLGKSMEAGFDRFTHLDAIVAVYERVLSDLGQECAWIQMDEPVLALDLPENIRRKFQAVYERLTKAAKPAQILLATYFGGVGHVKDVIAGLPVSALHLDLVRDPAQLDEILPILPQDMILSLGVVNGRNIWRVEMDAVLGLIQKALESLGSDKLMLAPSCSLLHVPVDLEAEKKLDLELSSWMAFARQKCREIRVLADAALGKDVGAAHEENRAAWAARRNSPRVVNMDVGEQTASVGKDMAHRSSPYEIRSQKQRDRFHFPLFPTTTIGSFPQTPAIRKARLDFKRREITEKEYVQSMRGFIRDCVDRQEKIGLDVFVHGEPERNDMVEYFGEQLDGYCFTQNGWVQSYGSRCVKPPIIFGDVSRRGPMTISWIKFAQSLTQKPMKGMLTGPVTMLCWSFVRDDQPRSETCRQIALAVRAEVQDLENAGIAIIQIDEPALREGLPLRRAEWESYLEWAVQSFRIATSGVLDKTQIHTHMCYAEFNEIIEWVAAMDADVISIEASRSKMALLGAFQEFDYPNEIGPGVYDIHSPRVPSADEMEELLGRAAKVIPAERLWVNPDCGLKTRDWPEVMDSLKNMVEAAKRLRKR